MCVCMYIYIYVYIYIFMTVCEIQSCLIFYVVKNDSAGLDSKNSCSICVSGSVRIMCIYSAELRIKTK